MADLGRQVNYGVGVESTAGTAVAPSNWINQLTFNLNPMTEYATNTSAWGNIVRSNKSTAMRAHAEGDMEAKLMADTAGLILYGAFGEVSSSANADASGDVYDHTFTINEDIKGKSLTFVRKDSLSTEAYALGRIGEWSLSMALDDYIKYTANILAKKASTTTATAAYAEEPEFVAKHFTVKTASSIAGLGAATAISNVESFTFTVNPNVEIDWEAGSEDPASITSRGYEISFEMTCRYNDRTFENAYNDGTELALQIEAKNTDVTIGTLANPKFTITAGRVNITDWTRNEDADAPNTQTMTGTVHYSPADAKAIEAVLTNTTASY